MYYIDGDDNYNSCLGLLSISHRRSPSGSCFYCCAVLSVWRINLELPQDFHRISIWGTGAGASSQSCLLLGGSEAHMQEAQLSMARSDALLRLVFDNVKPVAFPQMSCTLLCPSATAVPCLLCYYPCSDTLYSPLRLDFRSSLTTISLAVLLYWMYRYMRWRRLTESWLHTALATVKRCRKGNILFCSPHNLLFMLYFYVLLGSVLSNKVFITKEEVMLLQSTW